MKYFSRIKKKQIIRLLTCLLLLSYLADVNAQCGPQGCLPPNRFVTNRPPSTNPISSLPSPIVASIQSVVRVRHETASGASLGTATLVARRNNFCYFATCAHLFDEGQGKTLLLKPNDSLLYKAPAEIVAMDRQNDVALLRTASCQLLPVKTSELTKVGDLVACGFGSNGQMRAIRGPVVGEAISNGATTPSLRMRGSVRPGDSGGPVFDALGRLVAIVWGERNGETYAIYGAPLREILAKIPRPLQAIQKQPYQSQPSDYAKPSTEPAWLNRLEGRLGSLEANVDESNRKLGELANITQPILPTPTKPTPSPSEKQPMPEAYGDRSIFSKLMAAWSISEFILGAASVGGPVGLALLVGSLWWQRNKKTKSQRLASSRGQPIAVDLPPPQQKIVPETRYVSYEKDEFAKAHQWACEQLARKFPGSVEMLTSLDSLIRQQLAGSRND